MTNTITSYQSNLSFVVRGVLTTSWSSVAISNDIERDQVITASNASVVLKTTDGKTRERMKVNIAGGTMTILKRGLDQSANEVEVTALKKEWRPGAIWYITIFASQAIDLDASGYSQDKYVATVDVANNTTTGDNTHTGIETITWANARLDCSWAKLWFSVPNLTEMERLALTPENGELVYDTTNWLLYQYIWWSRSTIDTWTPTPNASETVAWKVEIATTAEFNAWTDTWGTGAYLSPKPSDIKTSIDNTYYQWSINYKFTPWEAITDITAGNWAVFVWTWVYNAYQRTNTSTQVFWDSTYQQIRLVISADTQVVSNILKYITFVPAKTASPADNIVVTLKEWSTTITPDNTLQVLNASVNGTEQILDTWRAIFQRTSSTKYIQFSRSWSLNGTNKFNLWRNNSWSFTWITAEYYNWSAWVSLSWLPTFILQFGFEAGKLYKTDTRDGNWYIRSMTTGKALATNAWWSSAIVSNWVVFTPTTSTIWVTMDWLLNEDIGNDWDLIYLNWLWAYSTTKPSTYTYIFGKNVGSKVNLYCKQQSHLRDYSNVIYWYNIIPADTTNYLSETGTQTFNIWNTYYTTWYEVFRKVYMGEMTNEIWKHYGMRFYCEMDTAVNYLRIFLIYVNGVQIWSYNAWALWPGVWSNMTVDIYWLKWWDIVWMAFAQSLWSDTTISIRNKYVKYWTWYSVTPQSPSASSAYTISIDAWEIV